jgi:hypothetical protein
LRDVFISRSALKGEFGRLRVKQNCVCSHQVVRAGSRVWGCYYYWVESVKNFSSILSRMCRAIRMQERGYDVSKPGFPRDSLCFDSINCCFSVVLGELFGFAAFTAGYHFAEQVS